MSVFLAPVGFVCHRTRMARNLDQLALDLGGAEVPKHLDGKAWLRSFWVRAYTAGREAGERAAEERLRKQIEWAALQEAAERAGK